MQLRELQSLIGMPGSIVRIAAPVAVALAVFAMPASATVFAHPPLEPAAPLAGQPVSARILADCGSAFSYDVVRTGSVIELRGDDEPCPIATPPPPALLTVDLGTLPAGTYDLRIVDTDSFGQPSQPTVTDEAIVTVRSPPCAEGALCLQKGRFAVSAQWATLDGASGDAHPLPLDDETGSFWFFAPENYELMVKVLDGCAINNRFWLYAAGLTDVGVTLHVVDTWHLNVDRDYPMAAGHPFAPIADTLSIQCTCENCSS